MSNVEIKEVIKSKSTKRIKEENKELELALEEKQLDVSVLKRLKERSSELSQISDKKMAIKISVIGVGQAGSRVAELMGKRGYDVGVINTSSQDLEYIKLDDSQKLLLEGSLGGTGKDLDLGRQIFEESENICREFIAN